MTIIDLTKKSIEPRLFFGKMRSWNDIDAVTMHQTACRMRTWERCNAHIGVAENGTVYFLNDFKKIIWHAQGLSRRSIGIEIEGNFRGIASNPRTLWVPTCAGCKKLDSVLSPEQKEGIEIAFNFIKNSFILNNRIWMYIFAHRQSFSARRADPGSSIWQVVLDYVKNNGFDRNAFDGGIDFKLGGGRSIPREWDIERTAAY